MKDLCNKRPFGSSLSRFPCGLYAAPTKCQFQHKTGADYRKNSLYGHKKGHDKHFHAPVLKHPVSISSDRCTGTA